MATYIFSKSVFCEINTFNEEIKLLPLFGVFSDIGKKKQLIRDLL